MTTYSAIKINQLPLKEDQECSEIAIFGMNAAGEWVLLSDDNDNLLLELDADTTFRTYFSKDGGTIFQSFGNEFKFENNLITLGYNET